MLIKDSIAIVTGGASGLGEACVRDLAANDAKVTIFDIQADRAERLAVELGANVAFTVVDVTSEKSVISALKKARDSFGNINVVINCAGTGTPRKIFSKKGPHPMDLFNKILQINLAGSFNVISLAIEQMAQNNANQAGEKGVIINTSSVAAFDGPMGEIAYCASKAALVGMTLPLARECSEYGIRVMTIAPGVFNTPMFGDLSEERRMGLARTVPFPVRLGYPDEFAALAHHIIENTYLNGEVIRLDGGIRLAGK